MKILGIIIIGFCVLATLQVLAALFISAQANRRASRRFESTAARLGGLKRGPTFPASPERRKSRIGHLFHLNSHLFS